MDAARLLSLAAGVSPELAGDPAALVSAAADAGWPAVGIWFDPETWTAATARDVKQRLDDTGLIPVDVEVIRMGPDGDQGDAIVDTAAELGASNVLAISSFTDPAQTAARLSQLCDRAHPSGVRVCLEFMRFTTVRNLADATDIVSLVSHPAAGILVDLLHVARSGTGFDEIAATDPRLFPYVQWCDGPAEPEGWSTREIITDALDARSAPGEGGLDAMGFERLFAGDVPFSMEVRSKALRDGFPDHTERAAHLLAMTRRAIEG